MKSIFFLIMISLIGCTENAITPESNLPSQEIFYKNIDSTLIRNTYENIYTFKDTILDNNGYLKVVDRFRVSTLANFIEPNNNWTVHFYKGYSLNNLQGIGSWGSFGMQAWKTVSLHDDTTTIIYIVWKKDDSDIYSVGFRIR